MEKDAEDGASSEGAEAPPSTEEAAPPRSEEEEAPRPQTVEDPAEDDFSPSAEDAVSSVVDYRDLIPSEEGIVLPDDHEGDLNRVRQRLAPRSVQSVISEVLSLPSSRRSSRYRRSMSGLPNLQETLKERQARFREARESRRLKIDPSYKYIFEILAENLGLDIVTVEELILDCPSLEAFTNFFVKDGCKALKFLYQEGDVPGIECGRTIPGATKGAK
ncbi:DNAH8 isoform 2, partial [Pongo abelii]